MRYRLVAVLSVAALLACGGPAATPTATVAPTAMAAPTATLAPTATPAPAVSRVGDTLTPGAYRLTLNRMDYPTNVRIGPPSGQRLVSFDVTVTALVDGVPYNPLYAKVKMADNTEGKPFLVGVDPAFGNGTLVKGEQVRGWLTFAFPTDAAPTTLIYEPAIAGNPGRATFALR